METYSTKIIELNSRDKDFSGFKWVLKAVDFEGVRVIAIGKAIKIGLDGIVATDGHRIHIYEPLEIYPAGIFKVFLRQRHYLVFAKTGDVNFPNYEAVMPDYTKFKELSVWGPPERVYAEIVRTMTEETINYNYSHDATAGMDKAYIGPGKDPIIFEGPRKKALVMPMRI